MLKWVKNIVLSDEVEIATDRQLVLTVLGVSLATTVLLFISNVSQELTLVLAISLLLAFVMALRGKLKIAGLFGPLAGLIVTALLIFKNFGIRDTAILGLLVVIVAGSLLNGQKGALIFGAASLLVVISLGVVEFSGLIKNIFSSQNTFSDYLVVCVFIMMTVALQWAVIGRLRDSLISMRRELIERQRAESALRESEERYRTFIAQSTEGIRRYDMGEPIPINLPEDEQIQRMLEHMYIAECNDAFARMYGFENASQLLGRRLNEMGLTDDKVNVESMRAFIRSGYRVIDAESHETGPDGEEKVFLIHTIGIVENGHLVRAWGTQRDITEKKHAEEEIRRLNVELEERVAQRTSQLEAANKELESFSYSISHDLRAPLRAIKGFSDILHNDFTQNMDPTGTNFLGKIRSAVAEMDEKIDALLAFSRVTRSTLRYEPLDLSQMAGTVIERLRSVEPGRNVACIIAPGLNVSADKALMQNLLENLLGNAWKYSSQKQNAQIEFGARQEQGQMVYFVCDNGAGFDMRYVEKLFRAFQRLHRNDEFQGHGIGLATVKKIVEHHGGRIWAEAEVDKGATFYFTLASV